MTKKTRPSAITLKESDYNRLMTLIEKIDDANSEALDAELARAKVVSDARFPDTVVAMGSTLTFADLDNGDETRVTLVFPHEADVAAMKISVLSPVGSALIGLSKGGVIDWKLPNGKVRRLQVVNIENNGG
ncbi:MAG: nucleoside diphosphate kinase regulator [Porticoccaceae bacterium]|nr:nucleoside diphosphate kinase regulator [Porticoccaceae bacterium]